MTTALLAQTASAAAEVVHTLEPITFSDFMFYLFILVLAGFLGYEVIGRVSPTLHTPLMSATNAISGISLVASLVAAGGKFGTAATILGTIAVASATINVVGGFMITDRMLKMFKKREQPAPKP
jgi:NAD(P) transhydrogenase subunit alpha